MDFLRLFVIILFVGALSLHPARAQEGLGYGSVVRQSIQPGSLPLSLRRATALGLENNLGLLLRKEGLQSARGQQWVELSRLLPNIGAAGTLHRLKENIAITGITLPNVPPVVGPFSYYDARVFLRQRIFDLEAFDRTRAAGFQVTAAEFSEKDARELVVVAVGASYLQALSAQARVETVISQVATARAILARAIAMHQQGVTPGIDELRARVELMARTQQLIVAENDLEKQKLALIRLIGVPVGQNIELTDKAPFEPARAATVDNLVPLALKARQDFRESDNLVKAAEASHQAAIAQRLPSILLDADYGATGLNPSSMYGTYHIVGSVTFPIFQGGKIHGDVLRAEALLRQRKDEREDLRSRIEYEVRTALLDLEAAARQVDVAGSMVNLAEQALAQAQERFYAGISDNLEVVQAQQSVAVAHEALISALYQHNLAKLLLARATGSAEEMATGGGR